MRRWMRVPLLAWVLWAQTHGLVEVNDQLMVSSLTDGRWTYVDGYDTKVACAERRKVLIAEQQTALAAAKSVSDFTSKEWKCYPESVNPLDLTRGPLAEDY
jgi:hypothetical protein